MSNYLISWTEMRCLDDAPRTVKAAEESFVSSHRGKSSSALALPRQRRRKSRDISNGRRSSSLHTPGSSTLSTQEAGRQAVQRKSKETSTCALHLWYRALVKPKKPPSPYPHNPSSPKLKAPRHKMPRPGHAKKGSIPSSKKLRADPWSASSLRKQKSGRAPSVPFAQLRGCRDRYP